MKTSGLTSKQLQRIERKKKKISAFLAIAKLNDDDRSNAQAQLAERNVLEEDSVEMSHPGLNMMSGDGPCRKRLKKEGEELVCLKYFEENPVDEEVNDYSNNQEVVPFAMNLGYNFPCTGDPYFNYYDPSLGEPQTYSAPFLGAFEPFQTPPEDSQSYDSYFQYHSYEVRRHHNSETFYYKTEEDLFNVPPEDSFEGKVSPVLENWEFAYSKKNRNTGIKSDSKPDSTIIEYEQLKRQLRERKKLLKCQPRITLKEGGERASFDVAKEERIPLFVNDIQDLLVFSQTEHTYYRPRWCQLEKPNRLTKVVVLIIEGFTALDFFSNESSFPVLKSTFPLKVEVLMPKAYDGNLLEEISSVPLCPGQQRKLFGDYKTVDCALQNNLHVRYKVLRALFPIVQRNLNETKFELPKSDRFPRTELLLSAWQLLEENFPVPMKGVLKDKYKNYVQTKDEYSEVTPHSPLFALDCEMCRTTTGQLELTRISIVNECLDIIYDTLVKPWNKITDYLTRFSGVTKKMLDPITTRLSDVQKKLREILPPDAILVGQSLNCDLHAMQMMHPYVIDTSVIFNITGVRSRKTKLMTLSREFLSEKIQESIHGHSPAEDSLACMKLVKLKLANSIEFGDAVLVGKPVIETQPQNLQTPNESNGNGNGKTERMVQVIGGEQLTTSIFFQVADSEKKGAAVGVQTVVNGYSDYAANKSNKKTKANIRGYVADNNKAIINRACEASLENDFILTHIRLDEEEKEKTIKNINKWTKKMLSITPINGMCLILLGNGSNGSNGICFVHMNTSTLVSVV